MQDAYPSVDISVNAIPPLGQQHSNQNLTQTQVDEDVYKRQALLMPDFAKADLFKGVVLGGVLPRKTFSMGQMCIRDSFLCQQYITVLT